MKKYRPYKKAKKRNFKSKKRLEFRQKAFAYHGYKCMKGGDCAGPLQPDHIKSYVLHPELEFELSNIQILCRKHNLQKGWKSSRDYRPKAQRMQVMFWAFALLSFAVVILVFKGFHHSFHEGFLTAVHFRLHLFFGFINKLLFIALASHPPSI